MQQTVSFSSGSVIYYEDKAASLWQHYAGTDIILLTDEQVASAHPELFKGRRCIILPAGEHSKSLATIEQVMNKLAALGATRQTLLVGIGGGVITDIAGFAASVYMRGIKCGFIPTTVLGMTDAAIGGKNGVNLGLYKNIIGTIRQPSFILNDVSLLSTLPLNEWSNGFAEIIKYACLFDSELFHELATNNLDHYYTDTTAIQAVISRCVNWKNKIVAIDEHEKNERKLLNFGHTAAHAIENLYELPHGQAVALGMVIAMKLSEQVTGMAGSKTHALQQMLQQYNLPVTYNIDVPQAMNILRMDKKKISADTIDYILLKDIGEPIIRPLALDVIEKAISACGQL